MSYYRFRRRSSHRRHRRTRSNYRRAPGYLYIGGKRSTLSESSATPRRKYVAFSHRPNLRGGKGLTHQESEKWAYRDTVLGGFAAAYGTNLIPSYLADRAQDAVVTGVLASKYYTPRLYSRHIQPHIDRAFHDEL